MRQVILVHTVQTVCSHFEKRVRQALREEVRIDSMLDTYFSSSMNELGYFSAENMNRLFSILKAAELAKPACIPIVCSSLSPYIEKIQPFISVPLLQIDKRLGEVAIDGAQNIMVLASALSPIKPTVSLIERAAEKADRSVRVDSIHDMRAFHGMMSGDMQTHEAVMLETAQKIKGYDAIVLAQGSSEYLADKVEKLTGTRVVAAPQLLVEDIKTLMECG